jgi:hypothetical protein
MERHATLLEVAEDGSQGSQPCDAQNDVAAVDRDGVHVHPEGLCTDLKRNAAGKAPALDAVAIGDHYVGAAAVLEGNAHTTSSLRTDEIVHGSRVQERRKVVCADENLQLHSAWCADPCNSRQGDHRSIGIKRWKAGTGSCRPILIGVVWLFHDVVGGLKEEETSALVTTDVRLIAVVAEALFATVCHLLG